MTSLNERLYFAHEEKRVLERTRDLFLVAIISTILGCAKPFDLPPIYWDGR